MDRRESRISDHTRDKKNLIPPMLKIDKLHHSSWVNDRLPEMLWAALIIGNIERTEALKYFRYIAEYVHEHHECNDITISGISKFSILTRKEFINRAASYSEEVSNILKTLLLFPNIPAYNDWVEALGKRMDTKDGWNKLANAISVTFFHQSEEATDCRWVKVLCQIVGDKLKFFDSMEGINETLRGIIEYPNYGELKHIRPFIRATEMTPIDLENNVSDWANNFWQSCFDSTSCIPEMSRANIKDRDKLLIEFRENSRKHYYNCIKTASDTLIEHFFTTLQSSLINARHETTFGIALYGLALFSEIVLHRTELGLHGRLALRSLVEAYITLKYLLQKEKQAPKTWDIYRQYGDGQLKLIYLKLKEIGQTPHCIDIDDLNSLLNEEIWMELVPINLGHWDSTNLRTISEEAGLKDLYNKYYVYSSGFIHATRGAIRESSYQLCLNPLHRYHKIPNFSLPIMRSVMGDAINITNDILKCLSDAYPSYENRITVFDPSIKQAVEPHS